MSALGPKADICTAPAHARFTPESGHVRCKQECPLWAKSGLMQRSKGSLFDQLVGDREKIRRDSEAERFGGCHVDDEINLACHLNRHIGGGWPLLKTARRSAGAERRNGPGPTPAAKDARARPEAARGRRKRR